MQNIFKSAVLHALLASLALHGTALAGPTVKAPVGVLENQVRTLPGPKRTVAVSRFSSKSDFNFKYGLADVGGGLSDLLTSALVESGQFIVVERETLSDVLSEQKLAAAGLVNQEGAAAPGNLIGASLLIKGAVTEFNEAAGGGGFAVGVAGVGVGLKSRKATVGLDIQVIDATTGQVIASYPVRENVTSKSVGVDATKMGVNTGFSQFFQTAIGTAARKAITIAVQRFAEEAARRPWTGRVVAFEQGEVVINAGSASGIRVGDSFVVERSSKTFTDPATGRVLGQRKVQVGRVVVSTVDEEIAFAVFQPFSDVAPSRGDLVALQHAAQ